MDTITKVEIFPARLVSEIVDGLRGCKGYYKIKELAENQDVDLIDAIKTLAERRWSTADIHDIARRHVGSTDMLTASHLIELSERAQVLLIDVQQAYYAHCKKEYGECPEIDCSRPLIPMGEHGTWRAGSWKKCPFHPTEYGVVRGFIEKKVQTPTGFMEM